MEDNDPKADEFAETLRTAGNAVNRPIDQPGSNKHSEERIAELRRLYRSGEYQPSAQDVASKLIDEHLS